MSNPSGAIAFLSMTPPAYQNDPTPLPANVTVLDTLTLLSKRLDDFSRSESSPLLLFQRTVCAMVVWVHCQRPSQGERRSDERYTERRSCRNRTHGHERCLRGRRRR